MTAARVRLLAAVSVGTLLVLGACAPTNGQQPAEGPPSSQVRIGLVEWGFTSSAAALVGGPVVLEVTNAGSTPHDMQVIVGDEVVARTEVLRPGEEQTVRADLTGVDTVSLLCTLPGHESQGMAEQMRVVGSSTTGPTGRHSG
ncbi:MAG TPA: hypothetical protein VFR87_11165 [Nocardioidaceae bacterium]|nr:hypothetical protein [Nocardioidaceae bacterium]